MNKSKDLAEVSEQELLEELARRRASRLGSNAQEAEAKLLEETSEAERLAFEKYLEQHSSAEDDTPQRCPRCGQRVPVKVRHRERTLRAVGGEVTYRRHYYYCKACKHGFCPLDNKLGLPEDGKLTPQMERRVLDFGVNDSFEEAASRWEVHYVRPISENLVRCVVNRQGQPLVEQSPQRIQRAVPCSRSRPPSTLYVQTDGSILQVRGQSHGREAKLAVVFDETQHLRGEEGRRGLITEARYVAHVGEVQDFEPHLKAALHFEGAEQAQSLVWLADGAPWIWGLAGRLAPDAVQILDWYHAVEAAVSCAQILFDLKSTCRSLFVDRVAQVLWEHGCDELLAELESCLFVTETQEEKTALQDLIRYYRENKCRMNYPSYVAAGFMIGSGAIEASHRHVLQVRMRRAGQHWSLQGADRMAKLRALYQTTGPSKFYDTIRRAA